jgi:hypothetical protein
VRLGRVSRERTGRTDEEAKTEWMKDFGDQKDIQLEIKNGKCKGTFLLDNITDYCKMQYSGLIYIYHKDGNKQIVDNRNIRVKKR